MIYLDTPVFVAGIIDAGEQGNLARECIAFLNSQNTTVGVTSLLTFDETIHVVRKYKGFEASVRAGEAFLSTNVLFSELTRTVAGHALDIMRHARLRPRDALHAATMKSHGIKEIVSEDSDFDNIAGIERISLARFLARLKKHAKK